MLIREICTATKLTKKAVEYYTEQGLIFPETLENRYRDFSKDDLDRLKRISVFRKLGLGTDDIKAMLSDETGSVLQKLSVKKALNLQRESAKQNLLDQMSSGKGWDEISAELNAIEQSETVIEKLLDAFPGYYGRFICLHFARFLNEPVKTAEQETAYEEIVCFLDKVRPLKLPKDLQDFLIENTRNISTQNISDMNEKARKSIENPEKFLSENKETLDWYLGYKKSEEYQNSPMYRIQFMFKEFNSTSGYYDIFIPAMKNLSPSYSDYYKQLETANEKLLKQYPEIENLNN